MFVKTFFWGEGGKPFKYIISNLTVDSKGMHILCHSDHKQS